MVAEKPKRIRDRSKEIVCNCGVYKRKDGKPFPHLLGGKCKGLQWVEIYWGEHYGGGDCSMCANFQETDRMCEVVEGGEPPTECAAFNTYLGYLSIPVPRRLKRKSWG